MFFFSVAGFNEAGFQVKDAGGGVQRGAMGSEGGLTGSDMILGSDEGLGLRAYR